jgi:hypothetical protein
MAEHNGRQEHTVDEAKALKKPYEKPAFRFEKVFETMALACGKVNATQHSCQFNRQNS